MRIVEREIFSEVVKELPWISGRIFVSLNEFFSCNFSQELVNGQRSDNNSIYSACTVYIDRINRCSLSTRRIVNE